MSRIPNSAMPHARETTAAEREDQSGSTLKDAAGKIAEKARAHPKTAAAAGAAVIAGAVAAAAIPLMRGRKSESAGKPARTRSKKSS